MVILGIIVLGLRARMMLRTELNPNVDIPYVTVQTIYPGAGPFDYVNEYKKYFG